jgi:predicted DNA-binding transcriptional regulator AlpA
MAAPWDHPGNLETPNEREHTMPKTATASAEPLTVTIPTATARTGLSRSSLYRLASAGSIGFRKAGRTTLVDWPTLKAHVANLPAADLRQTI